MTARPISARARALRQGLALAGIIAGSAAYGCENTPPKEQRPQAVTTPPALVPSARPVVDPRTQDSGWALGQTYPYQMKTTSWIALDERAALFDFDLTANVELTPIELSPNSVTLVARFDQVRFTSRVPNSQPEFDKFASTFGNPYSFTLSRGRVTQARIAKGTHPLAAGVLRTLSAALQFSGGDSAAKQWSAQEFDTTGQYSAAYRAGNAPNEWHKRKERYLSVLLPKGQTPSGVDMIPEVKASEGTLQLSDEGRPTRVDLRDEVKLKTAQAPLQAKTVISLRAAAPHAAAPGTLDLGQLNASSRIVAADEPYQAEVSTASIDEAKIDGLTFSEIASRLEEIKALAQQPRAGGTAPKNDEAAKRDARLFLALGATFRQRPETIALALKKIQGNSAAKTTLVDGLGSADTPEAQQALIHIVVPESNDLRLRTTALISLSRTPHPTEQSVAALFSLADHRQLGTQARYGLGTYSRRFRDAGDTVRAAKLGNFLLGRLDARKGETTVSESLRALANAGFSPVVSKIPPFLADKREQVRVDALRALALIDGSEVDELLARKLVEDGAKAVRLAAIEAMEARAASPTLLASLRKAAVDEDPHVRYQAVKLLVHWLPKQPDLRATLDLVASRDDEPKIRELAKAAL